MQCISTSAHGHWAQMRWVPEPPAGGPDPSAKRALMQQLDPKLQSAGTCRPDAAAVVRGLRARGAQVLLVSGDSPAAVAACAREVGIPVRPTPPNPKTTYFSN